jgi:hypothetical protein
MRCTIRHIIEQIQTTPLMSAKGLLTYNLMYGITFMKKYIDNEHEAIVSKYVFQGKNEDEAFDSSRKKNKKCKQVVPSTITKFFSSAC